MFTNSASNISACHNHENSLTPENPFSLIRKYNTKLLSLEKEIDKPPYPTIERRKVLLDNAQETHNTLQQLHTKYTDNTSKKNITLVKKLQALKIQFALTIVKCCDIDWQTFNTAQNTHRVNEAFMHSHACILSLDEQQKYNISPEQRNNVFFCFLYNFSQLLAYHDIAPPDNTDNLFFSSHLSALADSKHITCEQATRAATVRTALQLCKLSFGDNIPPEDPLLTKLENENQHINTMMQDREPENMTEQCIEKNTIISRSSTDNHDREEIDMSWLLANDWEDTSNALSSLIK